MLTTTLGMSERLACKAVGLARSTWPKSRQQRGAYVARGGLERADLAPATQRERRIAFGP